MFGDSSEETLINSVHVVGFRVDWISTHISPSKISLVKLKRRTAKPAAIQTACRFDIRAFGRLSPCSLSPGHRKMANIVQISPYRSICNLTFRQTYGQTCNSECSWISMRTCGMPRPGFDRTVKRFSSRLWKISTLTQSFSDPRRKISR